MRPEELDEELRALLKKQAPPAGFAERVIAKAEARSRKRQVWPIVAAIAAMLAIAVLADREYEQRRAEHAREQAVLALRIAAEKLNVVQAKLAAKANRAETEIP